MSLTAVQQQAEAYTHWLPFKICSASWETNAVCNHSKVILKVFLSVNLIDSHAWCHFRSCQERHLSLNSLQYCLQARANCVAQSAILLIVCLQIAVCFSSLYGSSACTIKAYVLLAWEGDLFRLTRPLSTWESRGLTAILLIHHFFRGGAPSLCQRLIWEMPYCFQVAGSTQKSVYAVV